VGGKPLVAHILTPLDGSVFMPGKPVVLAGTGTDLEDGPLTLDSLFTWSSSLEGDLGTGRELRFDRLLPGWHEITLQVADSEGFVSSDSVSILVGYPVFLPLVIR
jgi:serine protease